MVGSRHFSTRAADHRGAEGEVCHRSRGSVSIATVAAHGNMRAPTIRADVCRGIRFMPPVPPGRLPGVQIDSGVRGPRTRTCKHNSRERMAAMEKLFSRLKKFQLRGATRARQAVRGPGRRKLNVETLEGRRLLTAGNSGSISVLNVSGARGGRDRHRRPGMDRKRQRNDLERLVSHHARRGQANQRHERRRRPIEHLCPGHG